MTDKRGTWGRPDGMPKEVREYVRRMEEPSDLDADWVMSGGWLVCRIWHTPDSFEVLACEVRRAGEIIAVKP